MPHNHDSSVGKTMAGAMVTRRRMLRYGVFGGSALALTPLLGGGLPAYAAQATPAATPGGQYAPQTGVEREELIVGVQGLPATLDPARELSNVGTRVSYTPYDTLVRRDFLNNNEHVPSLATSWDQVTETELTLQLRDDVTFHNGTPFTADDVVFTFERILNAPADSDLAEARTYFSTFSAVERIDDHAVRITTAAPDPLIVKRIASWA